jgi:hypothetical protein
MRVHVSMLRLVLLVALLALALPSAAPAIVPPKDCGRMTLKGKRYQVMVDQISCGAGRAYVKAYFKRHHKPGGYSCRTYPSKRNRVRFYCNSGRKVFFAIRR